MQSEDFSVFVSYRGQSETGYGGPNAKNNAKLDAARLRKQSCDPDFFGVAYDVRVEERVQREETEWVVVATPTPHSHALLNAKHAVQGTAVHKKK